MEISLDPTDPNFNILDFLEEWTEEENCDDGRPFRLEPRTPVLATTLEKVTIPSHLCARVEGRSSLARLGLTVHNTAPYIDPGFNDRITLELYYIGFIPLILRPAELRICQLIIERIIPPDRPYGGAYTPGRLA